MVSHYTSTEKDANPVVHSQNLLFFYFRRRNTIRIYLRNQPSYQIWYPQSNNFLFSLAHVENFYNYSTYYLTFQNVILVSAFMKIHV
jgi:hypothetical protein